MVNDLILLNESIKTSISVPSNLFDMTGQWCPPGNYYFLINYVGPHQFKGELNCRGFKAEYTFASKDIIHMMAIAQARLARRANITDDGMPSYRSPNTSPINNYPSSLVSHNYNNLQPPHTSPTIRQHRRRLPPTNQRPICTICLDSFETYSQTPFYSLALNKMFKIISHVPFYSQTLLISLKLSPKLSLLINSSNIFEMITQLRFTPYFFKYL